MTDINSSQSTFSAEGWIVSVLLGQTVAAEGLSDSRREQIVQVAVENGVLPLLFHALSHKQEWKTFPTGFRASLSQPTYKQVASDMSGQTDLGKILDKFGQAGIPYLLIKGAGLAYTHYEHSYLRVRCDTDILFPDTAVFEQAWVLLESIGFLRMNTLSGEFVGYQHCCYRPLEKGVQQVLDCHTRINDYQFFADAFGFDELFDQSVALPQLADSARTLGSVHALLLACMHRVTTLPFGIADRFIWLFDMYLLAASFSNTQWQQFLALANERSICGSCKHSLDAAAEIFPLDIPAGIMTGLEKAAQNEVFKPGVKMKRWQYYLQVFKSTRGTANKARLLKEHFVPSGDYMMEKYQTSNRLVLPFLYVHRVFAGLKRYF